jgi:hypothetical protein
MNKLYSTPRKSFCFSCGLNWTLSAWTVSLVEYIVLPEDREAASFIDYIWLPADSAVSPVELPVSTCFYLYYLYLLWITLYYMMSKLYLQWITVYHQNIVLYLLWLIVHCTLPEDCTVSTVDSIVLHDRHTVLYLHWITLYYQNIRLYLLWLTLYYLKIGLFYCGSHCII